MDESPPATTESPDAAHPPEESAPQEQKPRRRLHVPTPVLVTVLLAALSVWIAPAFTRQWDDRQKARELQAEVADQIGIATAQTAGGLVALVESSHGPEDVQQFRQRWLLNRLRINARLRAYFPNSSATKAWDDYVTMVDDLTAMALAVTSADAGLPARRESILDMAKTLHTLVRQYLDEAFLTGFENPPERIGALRRWTTNAILYEVPLFAGGFVSSAVLATPPSGFSTTRVDLLRDLLP